MVNEIIGQVLGYAAAALFAISYQIKKNTRKMYKNKIPTTENKIFIKNTCDGD